ncbi:MAG: CHAT domain-containing protein, partial [Gemmataceae bacterium]|nr:CHAT domain-containing protein [Gemmataceae bacterium]
MRVFALVLAGLFVTVAARADDPPAAPLPPEIVAQLAEMRRLSEAGVKAYAAGKFDDAREPLERALAVARRLHGTADHPNVAGGLANLGAVAQARGRPAEAEPLYREALAMRRRLSKGRDDPLVALTLSNLARALKGLGKFAEAEPLCREALGMRRRLLPDGDHLDVALALSDLADALRGRGKITEAEPLYRDALGMYRRLSKDRDHPNVASGLSSLADALYKLGRPAEAEPLFRDALGMYRRLHGGADHPSVALALANLADLLRSRGGYAEAEPLFREALGMYRRLHGGADHPNVAAALNNLAILLAARGKPAEAEPLCREVLAMRRRLHTGDHPEVATALNNLAFTLAGRGKPAEAEPLCRDALAAYRALARTSAAGGSEGDALTYAASFPLARDAFLSAARVNRSAPAATYPEVWADKAQVARAFERRALAARAAATDPEAAGVLAELTDARRRRAELILAPVSKDPATAKLRNEELTGFADTIQDKANALAKLFPPVVRADTLAAAGPTDIQKALPRDAVVIDTLRYTLFEYDPARPGKAGEKRTPSYTAFVITKEKVVWVELGPAGPIEQAVGRWRAAVTADPPAPVPADLPKRVRELVWEPVRKEFPAGVKTVYVAPDAELTKVPWAALPGDKPNTILLEDFAVAALPHAPYLLDKLWPQDPRPTRPDGLLAVGGVPFGDRPASAGL